MKESKFIKNNLSSWSEYEKVFVHNDKKPEKLSNLFTKITDDLSYSYTYYNNRSVRLYLNGFAKLIFQKINQPERFHFLGLKKFYSVTIPLAIYESRKEFLIAFSVFVLSMIIGVLSSKYDPEFTRLILGDNYVEMTHKNIASNDAMAVYKSQAPFNMFLSITINNCLIAVRTFVFGFLLAVGTILILLYNGIMVGAFQYFFVEQGLFKESFLTIWQHGVFEISSIIMAGAAGLVLGKGIIFPGNYTRFQSLRISARRGLKLLSGLIPILVFAAFIEGFYTRYTDAPILLRILTILISFSLIVSYFILLPIYHHKKSPQEKNREREVLISNEHNYDSEKIMLISEIFMSTFQILRNNLGKIIKWILLISILLPILLWLKDLNTEDYIPAAFSFSIIQNIHGNRFTIILLFISISMLSILMGNLKIIKSEQGEQTQYKLKTTFQILILMGITHLTMLIPSLFFSFLLYGFLLVYTSLIIQVVAIERINFVQAINKSFSYLKGNFSRFISLLIRYLVIAILIYLTFFSIIKLLNDQLIQMNIYGSGDTFNEIMSYVDNVNFFIVTLSSFAIFFIGMKIYYFNLYELYHATSLLKRIDTIGKTKRIRGIIRE